MHKVIVDHNPSHSDNDVVKEGLIKSYEAQFGERDKELSIFLKSDSGKVFGGIQAMFDSEAIYIEALWVEESLRKQGYGKKLLTAAEREAIKNGCRFSLVDTWDFQAEEFYLKNGYEKIGELKNYWHGHSKLFLRKKLHSSEFHFSPAESSQISLIHGWLQQDHIKEWIHGIGLQNTLNGLEQFFQGETSTTYWIGYHKGTPFAFLITSPEGPDATTLDLFICDLNYLGKGFAVPMIREFLTSQFPNVKKVLIDPEAANKRAIHVYQKAGFKIIGEFIASWNPVPHYQMELYMKDLSNPQKDRQHSLIRSFIRSLRKSDISQIVSRYSFPWSTPEKIQTLWDTYYQEQEDKVRTVAVIEKDGEILGYGSLLRKPECPFFAQRNIPEINAIWIDEDHRRKGLGKALIKWIENLASQEGYNEIGIGVGLYRDYGPAQQLYFQLGYIPEGSGITYKGQSPVAGQSYPLDDELILWLKKPLSKEN